jgi:hypothetical protein
MNASFADGGFAGGSLRVSMPGDSAARFTMPSGASAPGSQGDTFNFTYHFPGGMTPAGVAQTLAQQFDERRPDVSSSLCREGLRNFLRPVSVTPRHCR